VCTKVRVSCMREYCVKNNSLREPVNVVISVKQYQRNRDFF
jgi:hypothetical protein